MYNKFTKNIYFSGLWRLKHDFSYFKLFEGQIIKFIILF